MTRPHPLAGCVVLVTADRRSGDLRASLEQRGATVLHAPAVTTAPHLADDELFGVTSRLLGSPPDVLVVMTAVGFRGWLESADAAGLAQRLRSVLAGVRLVARGAEARGAVRAFGLVPDRASRCETTEEVRDLLLGEGVAGRHLAVQHHGAVDDALDDDLADAGARVTPVVVHRWGPPPDATAVARSVESAACGEVDAALFTSAPAATAWVGAAGDRGLLPPLADRVADGRLLVAALGPAAAGPLRSAGIEPVLPGRSRLGCLVHAVVAHYEEAGRSAVETVAGTLHVRSRVVVLDRRVLPVSPGGLAVLRVLVAARGGVVRRADLLEALPGDSGNGHAVEVTVARLREAIGDRRVVETVVKRGYRLALARG